jgi:acyl-CoA reductase-like NAD-dependent aldehyde dehydrogenase
MRMTLKERLAVVRRARGLIAERARELASTVRRDVADTLVAEVLPLAEACRFLEREAEGILAPKRIQEGRPIWLSGVSLEIHREPLGTVLVIGPANYPLFLPATHALQAFVAGNEVLVKPGRGGLPAMLAFSQLLRDAGASITILREDPEEAQQAISTGVDKVILTGSNATGQAVMSMLAEHVTPAVMELSGCDPVYVLDGADLDLVVKAVRFGLTLNDGETCIAPKRVHISPHRIPELQGRLPIPVVPLDLEADCGYALGASIFGPEDEAREFAKRIRAGVVVINDMIVPTADPRLPFGGRGKSGFGVTRGAEGLLEMTAVKAVTVRSGSWRPHFNEKHSSDSELFECFLTALHGSGWRRRLQGFIRMSRVAMARGKAA